MVTWGHPEYGGVSNAVQPLSGSDGSACFASLMGETIQISTRVKADGAKQMAQLVFYDNSRE